MSLIQSYRLRRPPLQRNPPNDTQSLPSLQSNRASCAPEDVPVTIDPSFSSVERDTGMKIITSPVPSGRPVEINPFPQVAIKLKTVPVPSRTISNRSSVPVPRCVAIMYKPSYRWQTRATWMSAKIAPIRRAYIVVADDTGLSSFV